MYTDISKKCNENGIDNNIINYFIEVILPISQIYNGRDLLKSFLGITNLCNWILPYPNVFIKTLKESEEEEKKMILLQIKTDIEEYYNHNYLREEIDILEFNMDITKLKEIKAERDYSNFVSVPGKEWQSIRYNNIGNILQVVIPAFCDTCKSDRAFLIDIFYYLEKFQYVNRPDFSRSIGGKCTKCGSYIVGSLIRFPYFNITAPWINSDFSRFI